MQMDTVPEDILMWLRSLIFSLLALFAPLTLAADTWTTQWHQGNLVAVTPRNHLVVGMQLKPNDAVWGVMNIPIQKEQVAELNKHRMDPLFPFIKVDITVDDYYRTAQAHIYEDGLYVQTELDVRQWEGLKSGNILKVRLPDGSEFKETLHGSGKALRALEKHYR